MLVSIILTTLNSERFLSRSIESCLAQTHQDFELIIVDGGSRDSTLGIIHLLMEKDSRIHLVHQKDNIGKLPGAINLGMENSAGGFITWTQDDCWYTADAIEVMHKFLVEHPDVSLVYSDYWEVDEYRQPIKYQKVHDPEDILVDDVIRSCFLFRREVYEAIGPQEPKYHPIHEVPWRIKLARQFKIHPLHTYLMYYIVHKGSLTVRIGNRNLWWICSKVLLEEGIYDKTFYRRTLAQVEIAQAYDEFIKNGDYLAFWRFVLSGIRLNWRMLLNRGLLKFMLISLLPYRENFRNEIVRLKAKEVEEKWAQRREN